jgi:hypothetical protein
MEDLVQFLRARLDGEAQAEHRSYRTTWEYADPCISCGRPTTGLTEFSDGPIAEFQPCGHAIWDPAEMAQYRESAPDARVLAEIDSKRRIVDLMAGMLAAAEGDSEVDHYGGLDAAEGTLELLALPYADHPDYRDEWRRP